MEYKTGQDCSLLISSNGKTRVQQYIHDTLKQARSFNLCNDTSCSNFHFLDWSCTGTETMYSTKFYMDFTRSVDLFSAIYYFSIAYLYIYNYLKHFDICFCKFTCFCKAPVFKGTFLCLKGLSILYPQSSICLFVHLYVSRTL